MSDKTLTDVKLLELLCQEPTLSKLGEKAQEAFPEWLEQGRDLSPKMRLWIRRAAESLNVQVAPNENLFSALTPARQAEQRARAAKVKLPWER